MKKSLELKKTIDELKKQVADYESQEEKDAALDAANKLAEAVNEYKLARAMEDAEAVQNRSEYSPAHEDTKADKKAVNRAFNNLLFGRQLSDADRSVLNAIGTPGEVDGVPARGGYLVPEQQFNTLLEFRRQYIALKDLCAVQAVNSLTGTMPTIGKETAMLMPIEELNDITKSEQEFGQMKYTVQTFADLVEISNDLRDDADLDIISIIGQRFARRAVNRENKTILDILATLSASNISNWKGITKALNVSLDPALSPMATILTNQDGLEYMDELTDTTGRPLLTQSLTDPASYLFRGRRIVVVNNALLPTTASAIPMYVGSFADGLTFYDRKGVEVASSTEAGFTRNSTMVRAIERFAVQKTDTEAIVALTITPA